MGQVSQAAAGFRGRCAALGETPVPAMKSAKRGSSAASCPPSPAPPPAVVCLCLLFLKGCCGTGQVPLLSWNAQLGSSGRKSFPGVAQNVPHEEQGRAVCAEPVSLERCVRASACVTAGPSVDVHQAGFDVLP